uniref:Uncharacterized protein n=1 Tax=Arundo donax TaxID=35708 RepID=A0A0A9F054_ARUDO
MLRLLSLSGGGEGARNLWRQDSVVVGSSPWLGLVFSVVVPALY